MKWQQKIANTYVMDTEQRTDFVTEENRAKLDKADAERMEYLNEVLKMTAVNRFCVKCGARRQYSEDMYYRKGMCGVCYPKPQRKKDQRAAEARANSEYNKALRALKERGYL